MVHFHGVHRTDGFHMRPFVIISSATAEKDRGYDTSDRHNVALASPENAPMTFSIFELWAETLFFPAVEERGREFRREGKEVLLRDGIEMMESEVGTGPRLVDGRGEQSRWGSGHRHAGTVAGTSVGEWRWTTPCLGGRNGHSGGVMRGSCPAARRAKARLGPMHRLTPSAVIPRPSERRIIVAVRISRRELSGSRIVVSVSVRRDFRRFRLTSAETGDRIEK
jgi:hypothetical protein